MKKYLLFFLFFISVVVSCTEVVLIIDVPISDPANKNNISLYLMRNIFQELGIDFTCQYATRHDAMQMIDDQKDVVIFPYSIPYYKSNRILVSDTLFTTTHKIFFDNRIYNDLNVNELSDLKTYIIGSHANYKYEPMLRSANLTVHYSTDNLTSFKKLIDSQVSFVIEEKIQAYAFLNELNANKNFIKFYDKDFFPEHYHVVSAVKNNSASKVIYLINDLISNKNYINRLLENYFKINKY